MEKRTLLTILFSFLAIGFCSNAHAMKRGYPEQDAHTMETRSRTVNPSATSLEEKKANLRIKLEDVTQQWKAAKTKANATELLPQARSLKQNCGIDPELARRTNALIRRMEAVKSPPAARPGAVPVPH